MQYDKCIHQNIIRQILLYVKLNLQKIYLTKIVYGS